MITPKGIDSLAVTSFGVNLHLLLLFSVESHEYSTVLWNGNFLGVLFALTRFILNTGIHASRLKHFFMLNSTEHDISTAYKN